MATRADHADIADQARRIYAEQLVKGLPAMVNGLVETARQLLDKPSEHARFMRRRELVHELKKGAAVWHKTMVGSLRNALLNGVSAVRPSDLPHPGAPSGPLSLVDDDTIEREILTSRLALAVMDKAASEFTDLRARMSSLERREELDPQDMLRAHVLSRIVVDAWRSAGCSLDSWRELQFSLHDELAALVEEAYHETNRWLVVQGVLPDVDLHPYIKRERNLPMPATGFSGGPGGGGGGGSGHSGYGHSSGFGAAQGPGQGPFYGGGPAWAGLWRRQRRCRESALRAVGARRWPGHGAGRGARSRLDLLGRFARRRLRRRQFPGPRQRQRRNPHDDTHRAAGAPRGACRGGARPAQPAGRPAAAVVQRHQPRGAEELSPGLAQAIDQAQAGIRKRVAAAPGARASRRSPRRR